MTSLQTIPGITVTDPTWPVYVMPNPIMTSDTFVGTDGTEMVGRATNTALGGTAKTWAGTSAQIRLLSNSLARAASGLATFFIGFASDYADYETSFIVPSLPTASAVPAVSIAARQGSTSTTSDRYTVAVRVDGTILMQKRISGTTTSLGSSKTWTPGDRIGLRCIGTTISMTVNGIVVESVTDASLSAAGVTGIGGASTLTVLALKEMIVRKIDQPGLLAA